MNHRMGIGDICIDCGSSGYAIAAAAVTNLPLACVPRRRDAVHIESSFIPIDRPRMGDLEIRLRKMVDAGHDTMMPPGWALTAPFDLVLGWLEMAANLRGPYVKPEPPPLAAYEEHVVASAAAETLKKDLAAARDRLRIANETIATLNRDLTVRADREYELGGARERLAALTEKHARMEVDFVQVREELEREQAARAKVEGELRQAKARRW